MNIPKAIPIIKSKHSRITTRGTRKENERPSSDKSINMPRTMLTVIKRTREMIQRVVPIILKRERERELIS